MTGEPVIVVNQAFARRTFPGEEAVGKPIVTTAQQIGPLGKNLPGLVLPHRRRGRRHPAGADRAAQRAGHLSHSGSSRSGR